MLIVPGLCNKIKTMHEPVEQHFHSQLFSRKFQQTAHQFPESRKTSLLQGDFMQRWWKFLSCSSRYDSSTDNDISPCCRGDFNHNIYTRLLADGVIEAGKAVFSLFGLFTTLCVNIKRIKFRCHSRNRSNTGGNSSSSKEYRRTRTAVGFDIRYTGILLESTVFRIKRRPRNGAKGKCTHPYQLNVVDARR